MKPPIDPKPFTAASMAVITLLSRPASESDCFWAAVPVVMTEAISPNAA